MIKVRLNIFAATFIFWLILSWTLTAENIIIGAVLGICVSFLTSELFNKDAKLLKKPLRYLWFFYYIPVFLWECLKANIDGAYRVIHPSLPMRPGIVKVKTNLKSETALTFLANTLTLNPGTMTVDIDQAGGFLYVHWVDVKTDDVEKATEYIVRKFERILMRIFE
ncbi:MAG: Na+/H+ antiporter subunit E [Candidatus Omnitrophica bacterium]|jgi:multicomponent Na+:H+ antiporter subunit E|nr:Na+/H+ antiporter subunit E [Candidatus Omnitrophota bacterium]